MGKADLGNIHDSLPNLNWGSLCQIKSGSGAIAFIATGSMVQTALDVADNSSVWSAPSIKPLERNQILNICQQHQVVVVLEEHSIYGGLGSAITEIASSSYPTWICRIGIQDQFSKYCGSYQYLVGEHQLDSQSVRQQIEKFLSTVNLNIVKS